MRFPATTNRMILLRIVLTGFDSIFVACANEFVRDSSWLNMVEVSDRRKPEANKTYLNRIFSTLSCEFHWSYFSSFVGVIGLGIVSSLKQQSLTINTPLSSSWPSTATTIPVDKSNATSQIFRNPFCAHRWQIDWHQFFHREQFVVILPQELIYLLDQHNVFEVVVDWNHSIDMQFLFEFSMKEFILQ